MAEDPNSPDRLERYRGKRNFGATPEPDGDGAAPAEELPLRTRFVVHRHSATSMHWDLRFQYAGVLISFAIPKGLPREQHQHNMAVHTEDHPLKYIDFSGDIPQGNYGAGSMVIEDTGECTLEIFNEKKVELVLEGDVWKGRYGLNHTGGSEWLVHRMDPPSDVDREPLPTDLAPMLASPCEALPARDDGWVYEPKWDGIRALVTVDGGRVRVRSRRGIDITANFPELALLGRQLAGRELVLDGEIVALNESGVPDFGRIQKRLNVSDERVLRRRTKEVPISLIVFDLLYLDGRDLRSRTWADRRAILEELDLVGPCWQTTLVHRGEADAALEAMHNAQMEGVVAKHVDSPWSAGVRSPNWRKLRFVDEAVFTVVGWADGTGGRASLGSLLLADGDTFVGSVGSGFSDRVVELLKARLADLAVDSPSIPEDQSQRALDPSRWSRTKRSKDALHWVKPELQAEVRYHGRTADGLLRQPVFRSLLDDADNPDADRLEGEEGAGESDAGSAGGGGKRKPTRRQPAPKGAVDVKVEDRILRLTNLDKPLYPDGTTKAQIIEYLTQVGPHLLAHAERRALTMKRYPNGAEGDSFFEKQAPSHRPPWIQTVAVPGRGGEVLEYVMLDGLPSLVWVGNLAALELHTPLARAPQVDRPDLLVFDLDPGPGMTLKECSQVALLVRELVGPAGLGLNPVAKTSGSKGMQVYAAIKPEANGFELTKSVSRAVATALEKAHPDLIVSRMSKSLRANRIFVDWSQNDIAKTTIAVYSTRPTTPGPRASTPVTWDEVSACANGNADLHFTLAEVAARVAKHGDLFAAVLEPGPSLSDLG